MSFSKSKESFSVICADCKKECKIPFKPKNSKPVYCNDCFADHKPERSEGSRFRRNDRGSRFGSRDRRRESFTATCDDCGNECQIPFKPRNDKPVYCNDCFQDHR